MKTRYSRSEVKGLLRNYFALREKKSTQPGLGLDTLLKLADVEQGLKALAQERRRVLGIWMAGHSLRQSARSVSEPYTTAHRDFDHAVSWLTNYLNGVSYV